jgi:retinol dehydrogenase-12
MSPRNNDDDDFWKSDMQPFYARASFTKLGIPALLYSILFNSVLRVLSYVPLNSWMRIDPSTLHPEDCFITSNSLPPPIAIVTGSNTGVGFETAQGLAQRGYHVILACRSRQKGLDAADKINQHITTWAEDDSKTGKASFLQPLDLASFASIRSFCKTFSEKYDALNILVNNAGINSQGDVTEDGLEICFQSNFVGHFLLTKLLVPCLLKAKNTYKSNKYKEEAGRIVNLSSVTHHFAPSNERTHSNGNGSADLFQNNGIHDKHFWLGSATPGVSAATYRESKLASILFTIELNKRYGGEGVRSITVNPGSVSSDIWRNESALRQKIYSLVYLTPKQGSSTSIAGSIGNLPIDAIYLQPYWHPTFRRKMHSANRSFQRSYPLSFPMFEMLGPYISHSVTVPRLPADGCGGYKSSGQLWEVCEGLTSD